jgi:undecaprenyl-diphosphatase
MSDEHLQSIILGILQGLTEFLPISSSAHLILLPWLVGWPPLGLAFDIMVHTGTLGALLLYFRRDCLDLFRQFFFRFRKLLGKRSPDTALGDAILVGTLPVLVVGGLLAGWIEHHLRTPVVTVVTLILFGIGLWAADRFGQKRRSLDTLGVREGLLIGAAQALALVPGVSRAGITITTALGLGLKRADSARFAFLLALPAIALATLKGLADLAFGAAKTQPAASVLLLGIMVSFLSGFLCITFLLRFLQSRSFVPFALYRFWLAAFIFALWIR